MGTSEFIFSNMTDIIGKDEIDPNIAIHYYQNKGVVETKNNLQSIINVYSINGQLLYRNTFTNTLNFNIDYDGLILINVINDNSVLTQKHISSKGK